MKVARGKPKDKKKILKLLFSWGGTALVLIAAFTYSLIAIDQGVWAQRSGSLTSSVATTANSTTVLFENRWTNLRSLGNYIIDQNDGTKSKASATLKTIEKEANTTSLSRHFLLFYANGSYLDSDGNLAPWGNLGDIAEGADRNLVLNEFKNADGTTAEKLLFFRSLSQSLRIDGGEVSHLAEVLPTDFLTSYFDTLKTSAAVAVYLVRQDGTRIYNTDADDDLSAYNIFTTIKDAHYLYRTSYQQMKSNLSAGKAGTVHLELKSGRNLLSYAPLNVNDWILLMRTPEDAVIDQASFASSFLVPFLVIAFAAGGLVAAIFAILIINGHDKAREETKAQELEKTAEEEKRANEAKTTFLNNMAHDIRTPIYGIQGMTNIAQENRSDPETLTRCLNNIADSSDHLLSLINNILDLSTIESGKLVLKDKPFNLADMLDDTASIIAGELQNRSVRFHTDFSAIAHPDVRGDSLQLKRIFINFLGNSVKFTPDGRSISFTASEDSVSEKECHFRFIISDTGIGMSKEFQQALFQPFSQELRANQGHYAGTGLGMHISKDLVEKMGGNVAVQSVENEGTTIEITLALPRVRESEIAPSAAAVVVPDYQGKCILLAEDNAINQAIALYLLKPTKANVIVAKDGQEAIDKFMASSPHSIDLILMDIMMPRHDGYEATEAIRTSKRSDALSVPILAMTANAFNEDVKKAKDSGMNAHLAKPIDKNLLYQVLALFKNGIPQEDKP